MSDRDLSTATWIATQEGQRESLRVRRCTLEVIAGPSAGQVCTTAAAHILIGRVGADLVLADRRVSGIHAEITLGPSGYRLRDLESTNGTWIQGVRVVEAFLAPGTLLSLGESVVRFTPLDRSVEVPLYQAERLCGLIGRCAAMRALFQRIDRLAATDSTALITGETGTGKERVAEAIHERSSRARGPFVVVDCGAIPPALFEAQLFGYAAGAFTGATRAHVGLFQAASGGTLFLDEIGELPQQLQPKLLRAIETRSVRPVGATECVECDVRFVAATHRDLAMETNRGSFRADLYHRLAVVRLHVPPLRERREDLELLIAHFLSELPEERPREPLPPELLEWARRHSFPGNVRELRNAVECAVATRDWPQAQDGPLAVETAAEEATAIDLRVPFKEAKRRLVEDFDRRYLGALLKAHQGNVSAAARAAGLDRMSIYKLIDRLGIKAR